MSGIKRSAPPRRISAKAAARRAASGERHLSSTIARQPRQAIPKKKRTPSEFARIYGSRERVAYVKQYGCWIMDAYCIGEPVENAHTVTGGMGRKANAETIIPLCRYHHRELHRHGAGTFQAAHDVNLARAAARVERDWQAWRRAAGEGMV
jgi:hypothetical protein